MRRIPLVITALAATLLLTACDDVTDIAAGIEHTGGRCLPDAPACDDMIGDPEDPEAAARAYLGMAQADLPVDARIARSGDEHFMLTDDYVIGRVTVDLDPDASGTLRVVKAVLELEAGPVTVSR